MSKKALHILVVAMGSPCYCNIMSKWHLKAKLRNSNNLGFFPTKETETWRNAFYEKDFMAIIQKFKYLFSSFNLKLKQCQLWNNYFKKFENLWYGKSVVKGKCKYF